MNKNISFSIEEYKQESNFLKVNIKNEKLSVNEKEYPKLLELAIETVDKLFPEVEDPNYLKMLVFNELDKLLFNPKELNQKEKPKIELLNANENYATINQLNKEISERVKQDNQTITAINNLQSFYKNSIIDNSEFNTKAKDLSGAINELNERSNIDLEKYYTKDEIDTNLSLKQNVNDNKLNTMNKTVSEAINEIKNINEIQKDNITSINTTLNDNSALGTKSKNYTNAINELKSTLDTQSAIVNSNNENIKSFNNCFSIKSTDTKGNFKLVANNTSDDDITNPQDYTTKKYVDGFISNIVSKDYYWKQVGTLSADYQTIFYNLIPGKKYRVRYNWDRNNVLWNPKPNPKNTNYMVQEFYYAGPSSQKTSEWPNVSYACDNNINLKDGYSIIVNSMMYASFTTGRHIVSQPNGILLIYACGSYCDQKLGNLFMLEEYQD